MPLYAGSLESEQLFVLGTMTDKCSYCLDEIPPDTYKSWQGIKYCGFSCKGRAQTIRHGIRDPKKMPKKLYDEDREYIRKIGGVING